MSTKIEDNKHVPKATQSTLKGCLVFHFYDHCVVYTCFECSLIFIFKPACSPRSEQQVVNQQVNQRRFFYRPLLSISARVPVG